MKPTAAEFVGSLRRWYRTHRRPLPWRSTRDPYRIWISEVMLQQTTVEAVIPYYRRWLERYPDLRSLAGAPLSRVLKDWQGLGYYQRARSLRAAARAILERHGGRFPSSREELARLPGIGPYTAAAIVSLAFDEAAPVVEANVRRVMRRILRLKDAPSAGLDRKINMILETMIPAREPGLFNQSLMELGALVCRPSGPRCTACPVCRHCSAYRRGEQEVIPGRGKRREVLKVAAAVAVIRSQRGVLIQQRPEKGLLGGLWEFPGGRVEPGETAEEALRREVREELGAEVRGLSPLVRVRHAYTKYRVDLHAFLCRLRRPPRPAPGRRWVRPSALRRYAFPSGSARVLDALLRVNAERPRPRSRK